MSANVDPIYSRIGALNGVRFGDTGNSQSNGSGTIGTDIYLAFTADGINGSYISRVRCSPIGSVEATATSGTVIRIFTSTKTSGATSPSDTWLYQEVAAPSQTANQSATATNFIEIPMNFALPPSGSVLVSSHVPNNANTGWMAIVFGGNY